MDVTYVLARRRFVEINDLEETIVAYLIGRFEGINRRLVEDAVRGSLAYYEAPDGRAYLAFDKGGDLLPHVPLFKEEASLLHRARLRVTALVEGGRFALAARYQFEEALPTPTEWRPLAAQILLGFFEDQYRSLVVYRLQQEKSVGRGS